MQFARRGGLDELARALTACGGVPAASSATLSAPRPTKIAPQMAMPTATPTWRNASLMPAAMPLCCLGTTLTATSAITGFRRPTLAAGIDHLFEARIDGVVAEREHLAGKPAPDTFLAGARGLGAEPAQAAVFEDALAGVEAGRAWIFAVWVRTPSRSNRHVVMPAGSYALAFAPRLRPRLARLTFRLLYRDRRLRVDVRSDSASYELVDGQPLELLHHGERITVAAGAPLTRRCAAAPRRTKASRHRAEGRLGGTGRHEHRVCHRLRHGPAAAISIRRLRLRARSLRREGIQRRADRLRGIADSRAADDAARRRRGELGRDVVHRLGRARPGHLGRRPACRAPPRAPTASAARRSCRKWPRPLHGGSFAHRAASAKAHVERARATESPAQALPGLPSRWPRTGCDRSCGRRRARRPP